MRTTSSTFSSFFSSSSCTQTSAKHDVKHDPKNSPRPSAPSTPAPRHCTGHSSASHFEHTPPKHSPSCPKPSSPSPVPSNPSSGGTSSGGASAPVVSSDCKAALDRMASVLDAQTNTTKDNGATVTANAANVEDRDSTRSSSQRFKSAQALVTGNSALEQKQLAQLPPSERANYASVRDSLSKSNNPVAVLALQKMLFNGTLQGSKDLLNQGTVLDHLSQIAQGQNLDKRVDGKLLLSDLVQELATPSAINQGGRGTCAPTATAINLDIHQPAEYARIMQGLASPSGEVTTASKQTLRREADTSFKDDGSSRALTQRLLAPAIMEVANQDRDYHDSADAAHRNAGASAKGVQLLSNMLYGGGWDYKNVNDKNRDQAMEQLKAEVQQQHQDVMIGMHYGQSKTSGHELLVTGFEKLGNTEYVDYVNPWGQEERMTRDNFERRLTGMTFDTRSA